MFVDYDNSNRIYANLSSQFGGFVEEVDSKHPRARQRVNKNGRTVCELVHPAVYGYIQSIRLKEDSEFGDKYNLAIESPELDENGNRPVIIAQFLRDSSYGRSLLNQLVGLSVKDLAQPVTIDTKKKKYDGKDYFFVNVYLGQRDPSSKSVFPKIPKTAWPEPKKVKFKGRDVYDYTELQKMIEQHLPAFEERVREARSLLAERRGPTRPARNFRDEPSGDPQTEEVDGSHYIEEDDAPEPSMTNPVRPADELFDEAAEMLAQANGALPLHSSEDEKSEIEKWRGKTREAFAWLKEKKQMPEIPKGSDGWSAGQWKICFNDFRGRVAKFVRDFARRLEDAKGAEIFSDVDRSKLVALDQWEIPAIEEFYQTLFDKDEIPF